MNMFELLPLMSRHADMWQEGSQLLPEFQQAVSDAQSWYVENKPFLDVILAPKVSAALSKGNALLNKHKNLMEAVRRRTPEIQQVADEFAALSRQHAMSMAQDEGGNQNA